MNSKHITNYKPKDFAELLGADNEMLNEIKQEIANRVSACIPKIKKNGINSFDAGKAIGLQEAMSIINNTMYKYNYKK